MQNAKCKIKNESLQFEICNLKFAISRQSGFTLIELLIAIAVASIVGMAGVAVFSTSNWSYKVNEDVAEAQQNVRVAMERLSKDIRAAGYGLPDPPLPNFTFTVPATFIGSSGGSITLTSPITVTTSGGSANPDAITVLGIGYEAGTLLSVAGCTNGKETNFICMNTADFFSKTGVYMPNRRYISLNGKTFIELSSAAADHVNALQGRMKLLSPDKLDRNYPNGTPVFIIQAIQYSIENDCTVANPCYNLKSNDATELRGAGRQVVAENIEDIQFAYGVDTNKDERMDSTTLSYDPPDDISIMAVRASVVARTRNKDPRGATGFRRPCVEDYGLVDASGNCINPTDSYRRRVLTKILKVRNPRTGI